MRHHFLFLLMPLLFIAVMQQVALADRHKACERYGNIARFYLYSEQTYRLDIDGLEVLDQNAQWSLLSPRISFTYDITGDGKNTIKMSFASYFQSQSGNSINPPLAGKLFYSNDSTYDMEIPCLLYDNHYYYADFPVALEENDVSALLTAVQPAPDLSESIWNFDFDLDGDGMYDESAIFYFNEDYQARYICSNNPAVSFPDWGQGSVYRDTFNLYLYFDGTSLNLNGSFYPMSSSSTSEYGTIDGTYSLNGEKANYRATTLNPPYLDELIIKFEKQLSDDLAADLAVRFYKKTHTLTSGQTESYAEHDDGYYQDGAPRRYSRLPEGIVIDHATGRMWQDTESSNRKMTYADAASYCESLSLGGYDDWKLPGLKDLKSIVDYSRSEPALDPVWQNTDNSF